MSQTGVPKLEGSRKGVFNSAQIGKGLFHSFLGPRGAWVLNRLLSYTGTSQVALVVKNHLPMQEKQETTRVQSLGQEDPLE